MKIDPVAFAYEWVLLMTARPFSITRAMDDLANVGQTESHYVGSIMSENSESTRLEKRHGNGTSG
jgi:hypothetical protein